MADLIKTDGKQMVKGKFSHSNGNGKAGYVVMEI